MPWVYRRKALALPLCGMGCLVVIPSPSIFRGNIIAPLHIGYGLTPCPFWPYNQYIIIIMQNLVIPELATPVPADTQATPVPADTQATPVPADTQATPVPAKPLTLAERLMAASNRIRARHIEMASRNIAAACVRGKTDLALERLKALEESGLASVDEINVAVSKAIEQRGL